ncbi:Uncharacterised protein [Klebsiella oxytoca]|nr:Uncharacterised protein [Klebsiella oxytoca]
MDNIDALDGGVVGINAGQHAVLEESFQRMPGQRRHGAGLDIGGQTGLNADALRGEIVHQRRVLHRLHTVADAFGSQLANGLPDAFRTGGFACMDRDPPARIARAAEVLHKQIPREAKFIAGEVEGGNAVAVGEQSFELFLARRFAEGAAQNTDQTGFNVKVAAAFFYPSDHRFDDARYRQLVGHRHIARRETQFDVMQSVARGIFKVFIGNAAAGIQRSEHFYTPIQLREEADQVGLIAGDLYMRT